MAAQPVKTRQEEKVIQRGYSGNAEATARLVSVMFGLNVLSLVLNALELHRTGAVRTTSGAVASGHHELPAILAFATFAHQFLFPKLGNAWHPRLGYVGMASAVICIGMVPSNLSSGVRNSLAWREALPPGNDGSVFKLFLIVWNEAVDVHQYFMYACLLLHQLYRGYRTARERKFVQHRDHMHAATMFLLGPLSQRFAINHLTDRRAEFGVAFQVVTYTVLMVAFLDRSIARQYVRITSGIALALAIIFVTCDISPLRYLLEIVESRTK